MRKVWNKISKKKEVFAVFFCCKYLIKMDTINYERLKEFFSKYKVETLKVDEYWKSYMPTCINKENGKIEYISVDWCYGYELPMALKNNKGNRSKDKRGKRGNLKLYASK